jgi:hypothetical protein
MPWQDRPVANRGNLSLAGENALLQPVGAAWTGRWSPSAIAPIRVLLERPETGSASRSSFAGPSRRRCDWTVMRRLSWKAKRHFEPSSMSVPSPERSLRLIPDVGFAPGSGPRAGATQIWPLLMPSARRRLCLDKIPIIG